MSDSTVTETMSTGASAARLQAEVREFFADPANRDRFRERSIAIHQMAETVAEAIGLSSEPDIAVLGEVVGCLLVLGELERDPAPERSNP